MEKWINISLPEGLHVDLKILAAQHGCTLKALIINILIEWVQKGGKK